MCSRVPPVTCNNKKGTKNIHLLQHIHHNPTSNPPSSPNPLIPRDLFKMDFTWKWKGQGWFSHFERFKPSRLGNLPGIATLTISFWLHPNERLCFKYSPVSRQLDPSLNEAAGPDALPSPFHLAPFHSLVLLLTSPSHQGSKEATGWCFWDKFFVNFCYTARVINLCNLCMSGLSFSAPSPLVFSDCKPLHTHFLEFPRPSPFSDRKSVV